LDVEEIAHQSDEIIIYPNPTSEFINIVNANSQIERVEIIDIQGRIMIIQSIGGNQANINISNLNSGIYIIKIYNKQWIKSR